MRTRLLIVFALSLAGAVPARAQGFDGERFAPAAGAAGGLLIERPVVPAHLGYGLGLFLHFADDAVVARDDAGNQIGKPLDRALSADLLASIGLFNYTELALHLPVRLIYAGDPTDVPGGTLHAGAGVGDLRIVPKVSFGWSGNARRGAGFGFAAPITVPTGEPLELRGSQGASIEPRLLALVYGARWFVDGSVGFRLRGRESTWARHELTFGLGLTATPAFGEDALDLLAEVVGGWVPGADGRALSALPLEALAAAAFKPAPRWSIYGGGGLGLTNGVGIPDFRLLAGVRYAVGVTAPGREPDRDTDGVPDREDRCPRTPEDEDGFQDRDGCPEEDNDRDGIPDDDDECPDDAEEPGGDKDGCPDRPTVIVRKGKLVIFGKVQFPVESAEMSPRSELLIDEMARALKDHPRLSRIEIEGHTDSSGRAGFNLELSQKRAEAVKRALVKRGVAPGRLVPKGYGEDRPIAPNVTRAGRAKNRRVEFTIQEG